MFRIADSLADQLSKLEEAHRMSHSRTAAPCSLSIGAIAYVLVAAAMASLSTAQVAGAQCAFQRPKQAKAIQVNLVQAFVPCGGICFTGDLTHDGLQCGS